LAAAIAASVLTAKPALAQLESIAMTSPSPVTAGTAAATVTYSFTVDPSQQVSSVIMSIQGPDNIESEVFYGSLITKTITISVPAYWPSGSYQVRYVQVSSNRGNVMFYPDGSVTSDSGSTDLSNPVTPALDFTVSGGGGTDYGPTINSFAALSDQTGGQAAYEISVTPGSTGGVPMIRVWVDVPGSASAESFLLSPNSSGGLVWYGSDLGLSLGTTYSIAQVQVYDGFGSVTYSANGPPVPSYANIVPGPATINFASLIDLGLDTGNVGPAQLYAITIQPVSTEADLGGGFSVMVGVDDGGLDLSYQWYFNGMPIPGATLQIYSVTAAQATDTGSYTCVVSSPLGTQVSQPAVVAVAQSTGEPIFYLQPAAATISAGSSVAFNAGVIQAGATFQWYFNGAPLADGSSPSATHGATPRAVQGAANSTLLITNASAADAGSYFCLVSNAAGSVLSRAATLIVANAANPGHLIDLSCRAESGTGAATLIAGFATGGAGTSGSQTLLLRASGPALAQFDLTGLLPDPTLGLYDSSQALVASNSGWEGESTIAAAATEVGAFEWTSSSSHDSALLETLAPGSYTASVLGAGGDTGIALVEVYDDTPPATYTATSPRLVNLSARIDSGTGANILIAGFVIGGSTAKTVLIRGSGPALAQFGLSGLLGDPTLEIFDASQSVVASNTGWGGNAEIAAVASSVGAFSWGSAATPDSALLLTLPPGAYTAQVSGASGDTGVALVEIYDVQ
jgi:hypothetical protein